MQKLTEREQSSNGLHPYGDLPLHAVRVLDNRYWAAGYDRRKGPDNTEHDIELHNIGSRRASSLLVATRGRVSEDRGLPVYHIHHLHLAPEAEHISGIAQAVLAPIVSYGSPIHEVRLEGIPVEDMNAHPGKRFFDHPLTILHLARHGYDVSQQEYIDQGSKPHVRFIARKNEHPRDTFAVVENGKREKIPPIVIIGHFAEEGHSAENQPFHVLHLRYMHIQPHTTISEDSAGSIIARMIGSSSNPIHEIRSPAIRESQMATHPAAVFFESPATQNVLTNAGYHLTKEHYWGERAVQHVRYRAINGR